MSALLAAGGGLAGALPASIQKAFAIDPEPGTTWQDAEHIVILMQENRSFDHAYGTLRGVRGYNDPRAMILPNGNPVWLQDNEKGETYAPFRFDIKNTRATWMGALPHGWVDQAAARNDGKHDGWLPAKACTTPAYSHLPLTLGYYTREDLPFYYALADAFTICDQNFCSSLTATEPNRLHLWTGTTRARQTIDSMAHVRNEDMGYDLQLDWTTFPDRLEEQGISWRIYQNELSLPTGLSDEEGAWLSNFDDNTLEYFTRYHVGFSKTHRAYLANMERSLAAKRKELASQAAPQSVTVKAQIDDVNRQLEQIRLELSKSTDEAFASLSKHEQNLHRKGFTTNERDPDYRRLTSITYRDGETEREMQIPRGDVLYQFREDVGAGKLPTVSWLVAPERFSDHPSSAWYGAWYISETLNILTQNPEVWKKTIFIVCYDENDGYFDHVPPFVPPQAGHPETGSVSAGIDPAIEYVSAEQHAEYRKQDPNWAGKPGPIGLGFRVPLLIASPWSRGGYVCSQVFDHTSILQLLETFLEHKTGRNIRETNISAWRRTVCGDLTSVFRPWSGEKIELPKPVERNSFFSAINEAQFRPIPNDFKKLTPNEIATIRTAPRTYPWMPRQEEGVRPACPIPYELSADGELSTNRRSFEIRFSADRTLFGERAAGAPFRVYAPVNMRSADSSSTFEKGRAWDYAVSAGDHLSDEWLLADFENQTYHLNVSGPNGFLREFQGTADGPALQVRLRPAITGAVATGNLSLQLTNTDPHRSLAVIVEDMTYGGEARRVNLTRAKDNDGSADLTFDLKRSFGWYDLRVRVKGAPRFEQRLAGHIETGRASYSDPCMGSSAT